MITIQEEKNEIAYYKLDTKIQRLIDMVQTYLCFYEASLWYVSPHFIYRSILNIQILQQQMKSPNNNYVDWLPK